MKLPPGIREQFRVYGRQGGKKRAARLSAESRSGVSRRAALSRWTRERFGDSSFAKLGLPGGDIVDKGLADLANGTTSHESLAVSLAAPRLRREGVPVGPPLPNAEDRLYDSLTHASGDLAHAHYNAWLRQIASFADACRLARRGRRSNA